MAQETVTEYKTVEEQKTRTLCDNCGRTDEEEEIITVAINPKETVKTHKNFEVWETFDDITEANHEKIKLRDSEISRSYLGTDEKYALGISTREHTRSMQSSANADVCASCVFDLFGIEIPEEEEVEEIEIEEGELNIDTTKEVRSIWPQIPQWANPDDSLVISSWGGNIILWPLKIIFAPMGFDEDVGNANRAKGYIGGSIGAVLWTAIVLGVLWFTSMLVFAF